MALARKVRLLSISLIGLVIVAAGCTAILGADKDYHEVEPATGGAASGSTASATSTSSSSSSSSTAASTSSSSTAASTSSSGTTTTTTSSSSGATTCAAMGNVCVPAPPTGWTVVTFTPSSQPACPTGYGSATTLEQTPANSMGGGQCTCSCGAPQTNPCSAVGPIPVQFGSVPSTCGGGPLYLSLNSDGKCDAIGMALGLDSVTGTPFTYGEVNGQSHAQQVACNATAALPPLSSGATGRACTPSGPATGSCAGGETCLPPVPAGEQCIESPGAVSCPLLFPLFQAYVVYAPADIQDGRTCGTCTCRSQANTCTGTLTTYHTATCSDSGTSLVADKSCHALPAGSDDHTDDHFIYTATPDTMACVSQGGATFPVSGQVTLTNPITICCR